MANPGPAMPHGTQLPAELCERDRDSDPARGRPHQDPSLRPGPRLRRGERLLRGQDREGQLLRQDRATLRPEDHLRRHRWVGVNCIQNTVNWPRQLDY